MSEEEKEEESVATIRQWITSAEESKGTEEELHQLIADAEVHSINLKSIRNSADLEADFNKVLDKLKERHAQISEGSNFYTI